jgi:hypothetical protein
MQAAGRSLLGLRCDETAPGFLGKTLLTLVRYKGGAPGAPALLPAHKLAPHDVVALRPAAAAAGGANGDEVATQGVVYRVHEDRVVVAVDEVGDAAALDTPLRLDKLANKARPRRTRCMHAHAWRALPCSWRCCTHAWQRVRGARCATQAMHGYSRALALALQAHLRRTHERCHLHWMW